MVRATHRHLLQNRILWVSSGKKKIKLSTVKAAESDVPEERRGRPVYRGRSRTSESPQRRSSSSYDKDEARSETPRLDVRLPESRRYRERTPSGRMTPPKESRYSPLQLGKGRYRSRSPRRDNRDDDYYHDHEEKKYEHRHKDVYTRHPARRSLTPVPVREQRIRESVVPHTAYPLRDYTNYIFEHHCIRGSANRESRLPTFRNGDGKVNPSAYGSVLQYDLGLCYCTFKTSFECEMGVRCPWRHHPLSKQEKDWIEDIARDKGRRFLEEADRCWATPDIPVPGHNMIEVMQREQSMGARRRG